MSWIRLESGYHRHSKVYDFAEALGERTAGYYLTVLWGWVAESHEDGDVSSVSDKRLAEMADYRGDAAVFCDALRQCGFLDEDGFIHNWERWQGAFMRKREKDRVAASATRSKIKDLRKVAATVAPTLAPTVSPIVASTVEGTVVLAGRQAGRQALEEQVQVQVPVPPVGSTPSQVALIPEPPPVEKPKKRAAKTVKPPDDSQKRPDADAWVAAYHAAVPEDDRVSLPQAFWVQWSATRKAEGHDRMLRSLKAILAMPRDKFPRNASPLVWVTTGFANGITASSSAPIAPTGQRGAFLTPGVGSVREERDYSKPPPPKPVLPEWTAEAALARALVQPSFAQKRLTVPFGKSLPDGFQIPDGVEVVYLPDPGPKPLRLQDIVGAP